MVIPRDPAQIRAMTIPTAIPLMFFVASTVCAAQALIVRLYDSADVTAQEIGRVTATAGKVFARSGVPVSWLVCVTVSQPTLDVRCEEKMGPNEIAVRLNRTARRHTNFRSRELGCALLDTKGGQYATVYIQVIRELAADLGVDFGLLTGYAVAHEVAHCILGPGHTYAGLMRSDWTRTNTEAMAQSNLVLTKQQTRKLVTRLAEREVRAGGRQSSESTRQ
jgi:hypothetical protein